MRDQLGFSALKVTIFGFLLTLSAPAMAKDVALMIWVEDYPAAAFFRSNFDEEVAFRRKTLSLPLRAVFLNHGKDNETWMKQIRASLETDDHISFLILATHGETNRLLNRTDLESLGSFNSFGTKGFLPKMIAGLSGHWNRSLSVFLSSCSTFCGLKAQAISRVRGFFRDFQEAGVGQMLIWGATQPLQVSAGIMQKEGDSSGEHAYVREALSNSRAWGVLAAIAMGVASINYIDIESAWPHLLAMFSAYYGISRFHRQPFKIGSGGRLISINANEVKIFDVDGNDERLRDMPKCESVLTRID